MGSFGIPGYGGGSSSGYELFRKMKQDGFDVSFLNLIKAPDAHYFKYVYGEQFGNPGSLDSVYNCILNDSRANSQPALTETLLKLSPDLMIGIGHIAVRLMKRAFPQKRLLFLTTNCKRAQEFVLRKKRRDSMGLTKLLQKPDRRFHFYDISENAAVEISDLIITHSDMILFFFQNLYRSQIGKIHPEVIWKSEWTLEGAAAYTRLQKPFESRDIDVLFVASKWNRLEKNYEFVRKITKACRDLKIHIAGEVDRNDLPVTYHGLVAGREDLFSLFGRAKTVVSPSRMDPAPGVLLQAAVMDCNIVASKNCGNWRVCHEDLLINRFAAEDFTKKIRRSLTGKFKSNIDYFVKMNSYSNLMDIVRVF